jgi:SAM-dependent methyltransferase
MIYSRVVIAVHPSSLRRMEWFVTNWLGSSTDISSSGDRLKILDVGSYDVNGSYKDLFDPLRFQYTGLDMAAGPNVDLVPKSPYHWRELAEDSFDAVISGQALEHIEFFWLVVAEMVRVTREGGLVCIVVPRGFDEHRYPVDCYRFLADGVVAMARYVNLEILHAHCDCQPLDGSYSEEWHLSDKEDSLLVARKPYGGSPRFIDVDEYKCQPADLAMLCKPLMPYSMIPRCEETPLQELQIEPVNISRSNDLRADQRSSIAQRLVHAAKRILLGRKSL